MLWFGQGMSTKNARNCVSRKLLISLYIESKLELTIDIFILPHHKIELTFSLYTLKVNILLDTQKQKLIKLTLIGLNISYNT
jgi:hypothetical protein